MRTRAALVALGAATVAYGITGLVRAAAASRPPRWAADLLASSLAHDLLLAPVVLLLVVLGRRLLPRSWRPPAAVFLLVGGSLALVALPVLGRPGARSDNPTLLPRDYGTGLLISLAVALIGVVLAAAVGRLVQRRRARR